MDIRPKSPTTKAIVFPAKLLVFIILKYYFPVVEAN